MAHIFCNLNDAQFQAALNFLASQDPDLTEDEIDNIVACVAPAPAPAPAPVVEAEAEAVVEAAPRKRRKAVQAPVAEAVQAFAPPPPPVVPAPPAPVAETEPTLDERIAQGQAEAKAAHDKYNASPVPPAPGAVTYVPPVPGAVNADGTADLTSPGGIDADGHIHAPQDSKGSPDYDWRIRAFMEYVIDAIKVGKWTHVDIMTRLEENGIPNFAALQDHQDAIPKMLEDMRAEEL